jgi:hypothetical protein
MVVIWGMQQALYTLVPQAAGAGNNTPGRRVVISTENDSNGSKMTVRMSMER